MENSWLKQSKVQLWLQKVGLYTTSKGQKEVARVSRACKGTSQSWECDLQAFGKPWLLLKSEKEKGAEMYLKVSKRAGNQRQLCRQGEELLTSSHKECWDLGPVLAQLMASRWKGRTWTAEPQCHSEKWIKVARDQEESLLTLVYSIRRQAVGMWILESVSK